MEKSDGIFADDDLKHDEFDGNYRKDVQQAADGLSGNESKQPGKDQNGGDGMEHGAHPRIIEADCALHRADARYATVHTGDHLP